MSDEPIWEGVETITAQLIPLQWRLVVTPATDPDAVTTYWCEAYLKVGNCDEITTPSWCFRARTLDQAIAMLKDQVEIERDITEEYTGSRA